MCFSLVLSTFAYIVPKQDVEHSWGSFTHSLLDLLSSWQLKIYNAGKVSNMILHSLAFANFRVGLSIPPGYLVNFID